MERSLKGKIALPGDKSISHRALMLASIAEGNSSINNLAGSLDIESTINCLRSLGVDIKIDNNSASVTGRGFANFVAPASPLNCGNSGTTLRLLLGLLAASNITCILTGDTSLRDRPIKRVISPLERMGAVFEQLSDRDSCPVKVFGKQLKGTSQTLTVPSAQVKTAVLLAGLNAIGETEIIESVKTRDHTARMLEYLNVDIEVSGAGIRLRPPDSLGAFEMRIPSDPSSAAFLIIAALLIPNSNLTITDILINPTRTGFLQILRDMHADISLNNVNLRNNETVSDIQARYSNLRSVHIPADKAPTYIDEVPILALAATQATGISRFCGLGELRVKESNRLDNTCAILKKMGAKAIVEGDDLCIEGPARLESYTGDCFGDHRLAMTIETANLLCEGNMSHAYHDCVAVSFKEFYDIISEVIV